jgi:predicted DCC family thiol-disulfide oxidoreductase YuxK
MYNQSCVAAPPAKPLLVYDGDCHFCSGWVRRWRRVTGDAVEYLPAQAPRIAAQFPELSPARLVAAVQLILPDGTVHEGAEAVFRTLAQTRHWQWPLRLYESAPLCAWLAEGVYGWVATHRTGISQLSRWGGALTGEAPEHQLVGWLFLRALGAVYLAAFVSLGSQLSGLIGHQGILPVDQFMTSIVQQCDAQGIGWQRYHLLPTLCWLDTSDAFLYFQCAAGMALAALLIIGLAPVPCLVLLWLLYLSLVTVGRVFFAFQWDGLLQETGLLAIFLAPWQWRPRLWEAPPPSRIALWLLRLLLFKLMFSSGWVKLLSGDPTWRQLTALSYHFHTQPLPTWIAWYADQLPAGMQKTLCAATLGIEIGLPLLIFAPRRPRLVGAAGLAALQILILITGNYAFFNWLTLALCLLLLDDDTLMRPQHKRLTGRALGSNPNTSRQLRWPRLVLIGLAGVVLPVSLFILAMTLGVPWLRLPGAEWMAGEIAPLRSVNSYGLFAVMTTDRKEIIFEGSNDAVTWRPYEFRYKPGEVTRPPAWVAPFQPRLDWQMWFAALSTYQDNPWLEATAERLLQGSPEVLRLLAKNPFPNHPPHYLRARLYEYNFTTVSERRATGAWWKRTDAGLYLPIIALPHAPDPGH